VSRFLTFVEGNSQVMDSTRILLLEKYGSLEPDPQIPNGSIGFLT
jgi:hypothetical protein